MSTSPRAVDLSTRQRRLLEQIHKRQTAPVRLARRVGIWLALAEDPCLESVAQRLGLTRVSVRLWRDRWLDAAEQRRAAEADRADDQRLLALIEQTLDDAPRCGKPATFGPEQIVPIVAVACEPPEKSGRPGVVCSSGVRDRGGPGGEGQERGVEVEGEPGGVPERSAPPDPVRGHAQAQLVAEPDRDVVQHPGPQTVEAVQLPCARGPEGKGPAFHRLLQPHDGQAHRLALLSSPATSRAFLRIDSSAPLY